MSRSTGRPGSSPGWAIPLVLGIVALTIAQSMLPDTAVGLGPAQATPNVASNALLGAERSLEHGDGPARQTSTGGWSELCAACGPGSTWYPQMAYDPVDHYVVLFGGANNTGPIESSTWAFAGGLWTNLSATAGASPPARYDGNLVWDASDGYLLLFGGYDGNRLNDAWTFVHGRWSPSPVCDPCAPPARNGAAMTYDNSTHEVLLYGGISLSGAPLADAWTYHAGSWTEVCASCAPGARAWPSLAYDPADGYDVLFGGQGDTGLDLGDTWTFAAGTWTEVCTSCLPPARDTAGIVWDEADGFLLLFGGYNVSTTSAYGDAWGFLEGAWFSLAFLSVAPSARYGVGLVDDAQDHEVLLLAGGNVEATPNVDSDTWTFDYGLSVGAPTPNVPSVESGHLVKFTSTVSGGSGPYSYQWSGLPLGCSSQDKDPLTCTPATVYLNTTFWVNVTVLDANGVESRSPTTLFVVLAPLFVSGIFPSVPSGGLDNGQLLDLTTYAYDGDGTYSFLWSGLPSGCTPSNTPALSCTPTGTTVNTSYTFSVTVTDGLGATAGATLPFIIDNDPTVGVVSVNVTSVEAGEPIAVNTTVAEGSGSYTLSWTGLPPGCPSLDLLSFTCTVAGVPFNATEQVQADVTDSNGFTAVSAATPLQVITDPTIGTPSISPSVADLGEAVNFSIVVAGGVGGYTFSWSGLPAGCPNVDARSFQCTPTGISSNGTLFFVTVTAEDAGHQSVSSSVSVLTVDTDPTVGAPSANRTVLDAGQSVLLQVVASGGAGGYNFTWEGLPAGCLSSNLPVIACTPSPTATNSSYEVHLLLRDASGFAVGSPSLLLHVDASLAVSPIGASPPQVDSGEETTLSAHVNGGSGTYSYAWFGLPSGCSGENSPTLPCTPSNVATNASFTVELVVQDTNLATTTGVPFALLVDARPSITTLVASATQVDEREPTMLLSHVTGGSGAYSFLWTGLPSGCPSTEAGGLVCFPSEEGTFHANVTATDSRGVSSAPASLVLTVSSAPSIVSFYASSTTVLTGTNTTLSVVVSGGTLPYTYLYADLPRGCTSRNASRIYCSPQATGTFLLNVTVADARGVPAWAELALHVEGRPPAATFLGLPVLDAALLLGGGLAAVALVLLVFLPLVRGRLFETESEAETPPASEERAGEEREEGEEEDAQLSGTVAEPSAIGTGGEEAEEQGPESGPEAHDVGSAGDSGTPEASPGVGSTEGGSPSTRKCPLCQTPLEQGSFCPTCEVDWSSLQIEGRTDTVKGKAPPSSPAP